MMPLPRENDILFAHKALNIVSGLSSSARRVAGAIIDHFNRRTGQCDPSVSRLAEMLGINRATVLRATVELCSEECGLFAKASHGGKSHRAAYLPNWQRFREIVEDWEARMKSGEGETKVAKLRRSRSQNCDVKGRKTATQTNRINQLKEPIEAESTEVPFAERRRKGLLKGNKPTDSPPFLLPITGGKFVSREKASRAAAARRCGRDMAAMGQARHALYIEHITPALMEVATEREMQRRGSGLAFIDDVLEEELRAKHGASNG